MLLALALLLAADGIREATPLEARDKDYEVWLVDQSNSAGLAYGGKIYIYGGRSLESGAPGTPAPLATVDLGAGTAAKCLGDTGANPVRPHMVLFNSTGSHAILSFVASGHVVIFEASTRTPVACFRMSAGAGGARQAHAAVPTADDSAIIVANQNGKLLERLSTNYAAGVFAHDTSATLDLVNGVTPNGLPRQDATLRPDNAPICPFVASDNGPAFVSLRGGGMFVVDWDATPMSIVGEYDRATIPANGCGFIEAQGWVWGNAGGATAANLDQFSVYRLPMTGYSATNAPNIPARQLLLDDNSADRDAHGVAVTRNEELVWIGDRAGNVAEVFDAATGGRVGTVDLTSELSADPTPDLFDASPDSRFLYASLRGPNPLSGDPHSSTGSTPGLLVMKLAPSGLEMTPWRLVPISNLDGATERADAHGIAVRPAD